MAEDDPFAGIEDVYPATPSQAGMLFEALADPSNRANRAVVSARLPADLDLERFKTAWAAVAARHQALRSRMLWEGLSEPMVVVAREVAIDWHERSVNGSEAADALISSLLAEPFDFNAPGRDAHWLVREADAFRFLWRVHHALLDDWSVEVVLRDVAALYEDSDLPVAMSFREFIDHRAHVADDGHWSEVIDALNAPTELLFPAPSMTPSGRSHLRTTRAIEIEPLSAVAQSLRVTLGAVLTAMWAVTVSRFADASDVAFGLASTERPASRMGANDAVGQFVGMKPVHVDLGGEGNTLSSLIRSVHNALIAAQDRPAPRPETLGKGQAGLPFETIVSINEQGMGGAQTLFSEIAVETYSSFPLAMVIRPGEELSLTALYSPDRFNAGDVATLLDVLVKTLRAVPGALDRPFYAIAVDETIDIGPALVEAPLLPTSIAAADGAAIAIRDDDGALSYGALDALASAFASQMSEAGVNSGERVGVLMPRGAQAVAGFLAAWKLGAAYIPLDPAQPDDRLQQMVETGQAKAILVDPSYRTRLAGNVVVADHSAPHLAGFHETDARDAAYVMFTSGSTGMPKGVVVSRGNLAASTAARPIYYDDRPERFMVVSPFGFDSSVAGIYWTLSTGGTLVVPSAEEVRDIPALAERIKAEGVTHILCLPSLYDLLLGHAPALAGLRCVILAGEPVPAPLITRHESLRPGARLVNEYGPTEATVWCAAAELRADEASVPIGRAIPGAELSVHDGFGRPVPDGIAGELWVGGEGVARYLGEDGEAFTTYAGKRRYRTGDFVRRRADGQLTFVGRRDAQVKVNGQRVELGEVEARLAMLGDVGEVAVILQSGRLLAFVSGEAPDLDGIEGPMRPSRLVQLETLPKTATGKVDRQALAALALPIDPPQIAPEGQLELALATLWQDVLGLSALPDVTADFFALGGTSLAAMRLVAAIGEKLERPVALPQLLGEGRTVRRLARLLDRQPDAVGTQSVAGYPAPASEAQKALWFAAKIRPTEPYFNLAKAMRVDRVLDHEDLAGLAEALIARHPILGCELALSDRILTVTPVDALPEIVESKESQVEDQLHAETRRPFAMDCGVLWRVVALHGEGTTLLAILIHHTISDGWSLDVLMEDAAALLTGAILPASDAAPAYDRRLIAPLEPWAEMLHGAKAGPRLSPDRPLPERSKSAGFLTERRLDADSLTALKAMASRKEASLFAPLWSATATWLAAETGEADTLMAVSHAGRNDPSLARSIGCFTHALPYRLAVSGSFDTLVDRASERLTTIRTHEDVDLAQLPLPKLDAPRAYLTSFTSVALQFNDFDWHRVRLPAGVTPVDFTPQLTSYFEVSIEWTLRGEDLMCRILARKDIYNQSSVEAWIDRLIATVASVSKG